MAIASLNFTVSQSQKIILVAMTTVAVVTVVETIATNPQTQLPIASVFTRVAVGGFVATSLLLLLSYVLPEFAVGLAVVTAVGVVLTRGQPFWDAVNVVVGKPSLVPQSPLNPNQFTATGSFSPNPLPQGKAN